MKYVVILIIAFLSCYPASIVIDKPGLVQLGEDILFAPTTSSDSAILITASDVVLDLAGRRIFQSNSISDTTGIQVGSNVSNIVIKNGTIESFSENGILVAEGSGEVTIESVTILDTKRAIVSQGLISSVVSNVCIKKCDLMGTGTGIAFGFTTCSCVDEVRIINGTHIGIDLQSSYTNQVTNSTISCLAGSGSVLGINLEGGSSNRVVENVITNLTSSSSNRNDLVAGVVIGINEYNDQVENNSIQDIYSTDLAFAYGIRQKYQVPLLNDVSEVASGQNNYSVRWSPCGRFIAFAENQFISVYRFLDNQLIQLERFTIPGVRNRALSWSPDSSYFFVGALDNPERQIYSFDETGITQIFSAAAVNIVSSIEFSSSGRFIALAQNNPNDLEVVRFDGTTIFSAGTASLPLGAGRSVSWSMSDAYVALGRNNSNDVTVYSYDGSTLTALDSITLGGQVFGLAWTPDDRFLVVGSDSQLLEIYEFDGAVLSGPIATFDTNANIEDLSVSSDGQYITVANDQGTADGIDIIYFNGTSLSLTANRVFPATFNVESVDFHPAGNYLALARRIAAATNQYILSGFRFSSGHFLVNNNISNVKHPGIAQGKLGGIGLSASSFSSFIANNLVYDCDSNYAYVTNRFKNRLVNVRSSNTFPGKMINSSLL